MRPDAEILAEIPLFALLDDEERRTLAELFNTVQLEPGELIFSYGDAGDSLYLVRSGRVRIFLEDNQGQRLVLAENRPGELFGEISLLDGGPRTAGAEAVESTRLLVLDRDDLLEFITKRPSAALSLLTVMGQRLRATNELLRTNTSKNANQEEASQLSLGFRVSERVTSFVGSWPFVIFYLGGVAAWLGWMTRNDLLRSAEQPLRLPHLLLSGLVAAQCAFILMSQNRQAAKDRIKADLDYEVNQKEELALAQLSRDVTFLREQMHARLSEPEPMEPARASGRA